MSYPVPLISVPEQVKKATMAPTLEQKLNDKYHEEMNKPKNPPKLVRPQKK